MAAGDRPVIEPGYYQVDARRRSLGELWRMGSRWRFPLRLLFNHRLVPKVDGSYIHLPISASDQWCDEQDVPPALHSRLVLLAAQATSAGFTVQHWIGDHNSFRVKARLLVGGVSLFNGSDTFCAFVIVTGADQRHGVDRVTTKFSSYHRPSGDFHVTMSKAQGFDQDRRFRTHVVAGADFQAMLRAHRQHLDRLGDCAIGIEEYYRIHDAVLQENWKERIDRGLYRRICGTREELQAMIARQPTS